MATKATKATKAPAVAAQPWSDPGLKCLLTLSWLLREKGHRTLNAAIKKHVDDEDMYVSDAMEAFLVAYPLGEAELATFESIGPYDDWPPDLPMKLIPQFDGEDEPFLIARWDDLVRLPSVTRVACQREGAIPSPELVAKLPGLQSVKISTTGESGKRNQKSIPKFEASGFFVADIDFKTTWTTLKRAKSGPSKETLAILARRFPKEVYRKGKVGFIVDLASVSVEGGALVAHVELTLFRAEDPLVHTIGGEHRGESAALLLLAPAELAGDQAGPLVEARINELLAHVAAERSLPASLA